MSLKLRIGLSVVFLVTAVLVGVLGLVSVRQSRILLTLERDGRLTSIHQLARLCEATLDRKQEQILLNYLRVWMESSDVLDAGLWDKDGVLQIHSDFLKGDYSGVGRTADPPLVRAAMGAEGFLEQEADSPVAITLTRRIHQKGQDYGFLRVRFDRARVDANRRAIVRRTVRELLALGGAFEVLGLVIGFNLAWRLTRTIRALSVAARAIGEGRFETKVPVLSRDELGSLARDLERMAGELKRASEFKDSFLRRISHNMRSPLAAMSSALYHARGVHVGAHADVEDDYEILQQGIGELTIFVNNLLDLERLRRGKMVFRYETCRLEELVEAAVSLHRRLAEDHGLRLSWRAEGGVPAVRADRSITAQILSNLLLNAIKFTPEGGSVELRVRPDGAGARLTVADSGRGISAQALAGLFRDFSQVSPGASGGMAGSGIGLAFCKEAGEAMGARLEVESEPGRGSSFHLCLPGENA